MLSGTAGLTYVPGVQLPPSSPSPAWVFAQPAPIGPVSAALHTQQADPMAPQTVVQVLSIPDTFTNFNTPLLPDLQLFNPALGTLQSVAITGTASVTTQLETQNISPNSQATNVQGHLDGNFAVNLPDPDHALSGNFTRAVPGPDLTPSPPPLMIDFMGPQSFNFGSITASGTLSGAAGAPVVITNPADLAFYTASAGHTQTTLNAAANATASVTATNGNLVTQATTTGKAQVTVVYTYTPVCPPPPNVINVIHTGIHHQPTNVIITFDSPLNPATASNPANYMIIAHNAHNQYVGPGTRVIPITSAVYNPANNTVTLTPLVHLNVHHKFELIVKIPNISVCGNGNNFPTIFGGKQDLGPVNFHGHIIQPRVVPQAPVHLASRMPFHRSH